MDPRIQDYARLLVERCIDVQPGWQVVLSAQPLARPLIDEVQRLIARRGAYALLRLEFVATSRGPWVKEAPEELVGRVAPLEAVMLEQMDAMIDIEAPENTRDGADVPPERVALRRQALRPYYERIFRDELPWVGCQYPTAALAQDAGMSLPEFEDFLYGACLLDVSELRRRLERIGERFDRADEVRIVGDETDLVLSLAGRRGEVDGGDGSNIPGGEVFYSPVEDSAEGVVSFGEYPASYQGHEVRDVRLAFRAGRVVEASASADEEFLQATLATDPGAAVLGEFGIGGNPGIQRHMRNTLFDEKIDGTIHLALGNGFPYLGGTNESAIHWDIVKNLRQGGRIECDGEVVQRDGQWVF